MDFVPSAKELSHFPFLKKAQDHIKDIFPPLEVLLKEERGRIITDLAFLGSERHESPRIRLLRHGNHVTASYCRNQDKNE